MTEPTFKQFDIVSDHSDHNYSKEEKQGQGKKNNKSGDGDCFTNSGSTVYKKIMREWKILENGLPDTIYVRVYEKRVDLMRAVIVGAAGTPYHDGLYFFDIKFPTNYPNRPPQVHYRSHGLSTNEHLGVNGHICLSLLNTWIGWGKERWVPSQSTILQVLVSIQAFALNAKAEYLSDNEVAFINKCISTVYLLRNPPKNFEGFIAGHFRSKAPDILRAYIAYANGRVLVGHYNNETEVACLTAENNSRYYVPETFKDRMEELYPVLVQAFKKNGFSAEDWVEEDLIVERKPLKPFSWHARKCFLACLPCLPWVANDDDDDDRDESLLTSKGKLD
ncbi:putative aminoacyltransferase, E1 ubiquitin-activating enzyme [Rosa chinensis]|uniref:Putative aminoacyltransferase, E1 ubiquitin-activating enzyme n=1 Tax=Rosa chinensis TaxID=74649 RepID=A0A2P6QWH0_ROSCH|nr:putative ubiquitin-conjugating enzyme E2 39 [Rosa chinensis]PRQ38542.1 putative aminoacyltransferase, E1 ubiquitin-activating enzyme [Rosa chinensis]